ncbi:MAG: hypothetical protein IJV77_05550 [Clostridia bacterium]|nr:hypothetical protein [Clostridia bacterium]
MEQANAMMCLSREQYVETKKVLLFCVKVMLRDVSQEAFVADEQLKQRVFKMYFDRLFKDFACIDQQFKDSLADAPWSQLQSLCNKLAHCGMSENEVYQFAQQ